MDEKPIVEFRAYVKNEVLPALEDIARLKDTNRKHVQRLVYTNLVDRFDVLVDTIVLENCRQEHLLNEALKGMTQQISEADLVRFFLHGNSVQNVIDNRLKDVLSTTILRQRHSRKLAVAFQVFRPEEDPWKKPRVNDATGEIMSSMTPRQDRTPYSICGYADWLYSRRNSIVHGSGSMKLLENDVKQLKKLFNCNPAQTFNIKLASIRIAATFYQDVLSELKLGSSNSV